MNPKTKKLAIIVYGALALLVVVFAVGAYWSGIQRGELIENGIRTTATVTDMHYSKTSRKSTPNFYVSVNFFADTTRNKPRSESNTTASEQKAKTPQELKEQAFKTLNQNSASIVAGLGDYETASAEVGGDFYRSLSIGSTVNIVFDPKDHERIIILGIAEASSKTP